MWAEVSSSSPHFLYSGSSVSPIRWRCLCRVLCPVSSPVTTLDYVLLKDGDLTLVPRQGPEINSWACRWALPRFCLLLRCWFPCHQLILFLSSRWETPKAGCGPTNSEAEPSLTGLSAVSLPLTPTCPGTQ
jgi:hypothetical protein